MTRREAVTLVSVIAAILVLAIGSVLLYRMFLQRDNVAVRVLARGWTYTLHTQAYLWTPERSRWGCPSNSRSCHTSWEMVGTRSITKWHYVQHTSGTRRYVSNDPYTSSEPVYGTVFHYEIQEWTTWNDLATHGGAHDPPTYPALPPEPFPLRETGRETRYDVTFVDNGNNKYTITTTQDEWAGYGIDTTYRLTLNGMGGIVEVHPTIN